MTREQLIKQAQCSTRKLVINRLARKDQKFLQSEEKVLVKKIGL